jgi:2-keto-4-pentenoate hydratase/2-oxohepta-3-ene-1,7-dioic acid hydratase in catechol pathway
MKIYRLSTPDGRIVPARKRDSSFERLRGDYQSGFEPTGDPVEGTPQAPVDPSNIYGVGLNYRDHIQEGGREVPEEPQLFFKATTSVIGSGEPIRIPPQAPDYVDYEAELAVVIGRRARDVKPDEVDSYIAGYTLANDVSARDCQEHDLQWVRAKSFDTFCPLGPCVSTDYPEGPIEGRLNGELQQEASLDDMVFLPERIVSYLSHQFTLLPRTVILTGTPSGVGFAQDPPRFLQPGDEYEVRIPGIGTLSNPVKEPEEKPD